MAANFRMIFDNVADSATLSVSSAASGSLGASNLVTDIKSQVWRAAGPAGAITATWTAAQLLGGVSLPYTNLSATATMRVQAYTETADASPIYDSGAVLCCPSVPLGLLSWGSDILGVNAYSYGGYSCGRVWFDQHYAVKKVVITITDTSNPAGYIEAGRLVCGAFWEGDKNVDYGVALTVVDTTKNYRNDAGDLLSDTAPRHRKLTFSLSNMTASDRRKLFNVLWGNGMSVPIFFSLLPNDADATLEQTHQIYCKLMNNPAMAIPSFLQYAASLELEEV